MAFLKKVDHITYACARGTIEKWAWFHIEIEGGVLINRIDDVRPEDPDSSMKIWCIDYGEFGIALIEGIDRRKQSQVTRFVEHKGDHSCQHVAYDCHDLDAFRAHLVKSGCPEYVQRPRHGDEDLTITFSQGAGRGFYEQLENARAAGDEEPFVDFSRMPKDWRVPKPVARGTATETPARQSRAKP